MTPTSRNATVALMAVAIQIGAWSGHAYGESISGSGDNATLVLHVINYASLPSAVLDVAKARVAMVYDLIGVRIVWIDNEETVVGRHKGQLHLTVLLLSRDMAVKKIAADHIEEGVLAQAQAAAGRASIFCDRIETAPTAAKPFAIPLGDVIAHEVGHLILGANSHSRSGIMRAKMDLRVFLVRSFDQGQAATIRTSLREPTTSTTRR